jgi:hypothetical protein
MAEQWGASRMHKLGSRHAQLEAEGDLEGPNGPQTHQVIGILWADGELMGGERIWASETCLRAMLGPLFDELEPIRKES